jgi:hypothetical protein
MFAAYAIRIEIATGPGARTAIGVIATTPFCHQMTIYLTRIENDQASYPMPSLATAK